MSGELTQAELGARFELGLERMPARRRAIFLAVRLDRLTYQAIAARTGLSVRQVEREVVAALVELDRAVCGDEPPWLDRLWTWFAARFAR